MSLFSGFQNKQIQHEYDQLVSLLIASLTKRVVKFYKNEECDESAFKNIMNKIIIGLKNYEQQKFMPPRFSENVKLLCDIIQEKQAEEVTKIVIQNDQLYSQKDFNTITNKANLLLHHDPVSQLQPIQINKISDELPPHPTQFIDKSSNIESDKLGNTERNQKIELFVKTNERSNKGISSMATPKRGSSAHNQLPLSKEQLQQIEESVTQNLLDKLTFQKKKKKSKNLDNSVQFRKLLLQPDKTNQSFSVTRRTVYNIKKDSY